MKLFRCFNPKCQRAECHTYRICEGRKTLPAEYVAIFKLKNSTILHTSVLTCTLSSHPGEVWHHRPRRKGGVVLRDRTSLVGRGQEGRVALESGGTEGLDGAVAFTEEGDWVAEPRDRERAPPRWETEAGVSGRQVCDQAGSAPS